MLLEVQCEVSTVSDDLGCHVICWCWSTVFSEVHSQHSHLPGNFRAQNTCESFTRSGLKLESVHQESPRSDVFRQKGYQATSEPETTSEASYLGCGEKELSGPKSSFQMKVNFAFHLEIKVPESGGRVERHRIHVA